ncbi:MAG: YcxB family protein [Ruminococcaceae bacterium]|nr:YcxB family protein [Oscillospiraceae bacterium]
MFSKTYGVTEWMRTTEFTDAAIILTDHTTVNQVRYENIEQIKEKGNCVMIYLNHNMALRIYKDAFVEGTWEACIEKIEAMRN